MSRLTSNQAPSGRLYMPLQGSGRKKADGPSPHSLFCPMALGWELLEIAKDSDTPTSQIPEQRYGAKPTCLPPNFQPPHT